MKERSRNNPCQEAGTRAVIVLDAHVLVALHQPSVDDAGPEQHALAAHAPTVVAAYGGADEDVQRAQAAGYEAVVVTLDTWMLGWRPRDLSGRTDFRSHSQPVLCDAGPYLYRFLSSR